MRENGALSGPGVLATNGYDPLSRRTSLTRGNGTSGGYGYDLASRLNTLTQDVAGTGADRSRTFTHNLAGQIRVRTSSNTLFDWVAPNVTKSYVSNGRNQYTTVAGATFSYDARGNLTGDGSRTFSYGVENRLLTVGGSASMTLDYDPLGWLRQTVSGGVTTQFLYDGDRLMAEYDAAGTLLRRYAHGAGVDEPLVWYEGAGLTDRRWLHADERGSVLASTDGAGAATAYRYGPYGEPDTWSGSRFKYTGQIALGPLVELYHYKARVYDPVLGRFLQTDPIGYDDDVNLYAYPKNDPINLTDPTGSLGVGRAARWVLRQGDDRLRGMLPWVAARAANRAVARARKYAVEQAWKEEQRLALLGKETTYPWDAAQLAKLKSDGSVPGFEGHHINNVADHPQLAGDPDNIQFVNKAEHAAAHPGGFNLPTSGPVVDRTMGGALPRIGEYKPSSLDFVKPTLSGLAVAQGMLFIGTVTPVLEAMDYVDPLVYITCSADCPIQF